MSKTKMIKGLQEEILNVYKGLLVMHGELGDNDVAVIEYKFNELEYRDLLNNYALDKIAGEGNEFIKMQRVVNHFAPKLKHESMYGNHIAMDALSLLAYSYNKPKQGINCLSKAKILQECALALGIYARRMGMMPFNPYDLDNHVVIEIYDRTLRKWIMFDPSTNAWIRNEDKTPLSLLEVRQHVINNKFVEVMFNDNKGKENDKKELLTYYIKNLFYLKVDEINGFGEHGKSLALYPADFDLNKREVARLQFRYDYFKKHNIVDESVLNKAKTYLENYQETLYPNYNLNVLTDEPI